MAQKNFSCFCITLSTSDAVVVTEQDQMRNHNDLTSFHLIRKLFDQQIIWSEGQWKWKKLLPPLSWSPLGQFSEGRRMSQEKVFRELLTFHPASVWSFQLELGVQQRANHLRLHSLVSEAALIWWLKFIWRNRPLHCEDVWCYLHGCHLAVTVEGKSEMRK